MAFAALAVNIAASDVSDNTQFHGDVIVIETSQMHRQKTN